MKYWKHKKLRPCICAGAKKMLRGTTLLRHENILTPSSALYRERPAEFHVIAWVLPRIQETGTDASANRAPFSHEPALLRLA